MLGSLVFTNLPEILIFRIRNSIPLKAEKLFRVKYSLSAKTKKFFFLQKKNGSQTGSSEGGESSDAVEAQPND